MTKRLLGTPTAEQINRAQQRSAEHNMPYDEALDQVMRIDRDNEEDDE